MTYRAKLIIAICAVSVLTLAALMINRMLLVEEILFERAQTRLVSAGGVFSREIIDDLVQDRIERVRDALGFLASQKRISLALIYDQNGIVRSASDERFVGLPVPYHDGQQRLGDEQVLIQSFPLLDHDVSFGTLQLALSLEQMHRDLVVLFIWSAVLSVLMLVFIIGVSWKLSGRLLKPLEAMRQAAEGIARGDFSREILVQSQDVIGALGRSFNHMAHELDDMTRHLQERIDEATAKLAAANALLTEKKQELERGNRRLVELDRMKTEFLSIVSHDLRNPLTAVIGLADSMQRMPLSEEKRMHYLDMIKSEGVRMTDIIEAYLDITKIESGGIRLLKKLTDVAKLCADSVRAIKMTSGVHVELDFPESMPTVKVDPDRMRQVIVNIVDNAIKVSPPTGHVTVSGKALPDAVQISVEDEGPGISPEERDRIFEKYYRSEDRHNVYKGRGLGLAIARGIIEMHGGKIWAEEGNNGGARMVLSLPRTEA